MKTTTAYNHLSRLKSALESAFSAAECYKPTHADLLASVSKIYATIPPKCPAWVKQSLFDYSQSRFERINRELTIWLHPTADGFKNWDLLTESERADCAKPGYSGSRVWLHETTGQGTIADKNIYRQGATIARTFEITGKVF